MKTTHPAAGTVSATVLVGSVVVANWMTSTLGFLPVGFGQQATAGTFAAGFALAFRDAVQDAFGKRVMLLVLIAAALLSYAVADPAVATASAAAFLVSELLDFAVYTPLRRRSRFGDRRWAVAVGASGIVGAVVDSVIFLALAFGWAAVGAGMIGQLIGKAYATLTYLVLGRLASRTWRE